MASISDDIRKHQPLQIQHDKYHHVHSTNSTNSISPPETKRRLGVVLISASQLILRALSFAFSLSAAVSTVTNIQTTEVLPGFVLVARYSYSSSLRFFVVANLVGSAFSLFSVLYLFKRRSATRSFYIPPKHYSFALFIHDLLVTALLLAGCSAATAIGLVAKNGVARSGWMPICNHFHRFCNVGAVSLALSYSSFLSFFILTVLSAAMSKHTQDL
ncbi:CASP-like protein 1F1 [Linum grandiflorum]